MRRVEDRKGTWPQPFGVEILDLGGKARRKIARVEGRDGTDAALPRNQAAPKILTGVPEGRHCPEPGDDHASLSQNGPLLWRFPPGTFRAGPPILPPEPPCAIVLRPCSFSISNSSHPRRVPAPPGTAA